MTSQTIVAEAKSYANELNTFAYEYGFSSQDGWLLVLTSDTKKAEIEKKFYPTLSIAVPPELADEFRNLVISKLKHLKSEEEQKALSQPTLKNTNSITAYNPDRIM